jgi:hypothetical protein
LVSRKPKSPFHPDPFLEVRVHDLVPPPGLTALCAGYEEKKWRCKALADHLIEWLPDFALKYSELERFGPHNAVALLREAARSIYTTGRYQNRGELGEILLHIAMRQVFKTAPAVAKCFFKDSANNTVKGFGAVHVLATGSSFELWLGEVKFYENVTSAITAVVKELQAHTERNYMRDECTFIAKKIDPDWPHAEKLKALLHQNTSMDKIFAAVCIPVLLTYNSATIAAHNVVTAAFETALAGEVRKHHRSFCSKGLPTNVRIHLFLIPLGEKGELVKAFHKRLKSHQ